MAKLQQIEKTCDHAVTVDVTAVYLVRSAKCPDAELQRW